MKLSALLQHVPYRLVQGDLEQEIRDVNFDSRRIGPQHAFVALKGMSIDGHQFIDKAITQGATTILVENIPDEMKGGITYIQLSEGRKALSLILANYYGYPAQKLKIVGVTGTNGKTTTATLMHDLFQSLGYMSGLISTIRYKVGDEIFPSSHTTPDPKQLQQLFAQMVEVGCEYCFMEVSSHALVQERVAGIEFQLAMFTNITHDHLDYHGTFKAYIEAKKMLFDGLKKGAAALVNADDKNGRVMVQNTSAVVKTYALKRVADYRGKLLENTFEGLYMEVDGQEVWFRMRGSFNAYNLLMVYGGARELGLEKEEILAGLSALEGAEGRFEVIRSSDQQTAVVDYAHTPDALKNVLQTILDIDKGNHQVITVVGCGGDRDRTKRPVMGQIAANLSERVILTSDNPRSEDPLVILEEMYGGISKDLMHKVLKISDRKEAIRAACAMARPGDIILIAGKGHETYQEIKGVKHPFDDRIVVKDAFAIPNGDS
ncbi:MAG: UDP-N-acetylmuramoyl-L-alanyl-D-glutamate--2,6-diaminopimelate ligase [Bacteroidota bacterium]